MGEIGDVPWNEDMYEDLVLPEDEKDLLLSITKCHVDSSKDTDPTSETKGKGIVICLNGPKGSGKAMAVEAVAEKLHMPLYNINIDVANINGDCQRLDDVVYSAFERARKWNIAMVFHNIDFLLSDANDGSWNHECVARKSPPLSVSPLHHFTPSIHPSRLTHATVLAHDLTTHPAPVFFTTSKIRDIDPFLRTHFDLTLHLPTPFPPLASRRQMWENALSAAVPSLRQRHRHFTTEQLDQLAETELSGREIKSVVKMAVMLARGKGEAFGMGALERVLRLKEKEKEGEEDGDAEESEEE